MELDEASRRPAMEEATAALLHLGSEAYSARPHGK